MTNKTNMSKHLKSMAATLLCIVLAACGGTPTGKNVSDIPSDGILEKYGRTL